MQKSLTPLKLMTSDKKQTLISELTVAHRFWSRAKGLLGTHELPADQAMLFYRCNSIHTFFMKYSIDCVFVDKQMRIKALLPEIKPNRLIFPVWRASTVIEMKAGQIHKLGLKLGDGLYVGS